MKIAAYIGALLGLALLTALFIHEGYAAVLQALGLAGWALLWLMPYRMLYFLLYAVGWSRLLQPCDPQRRASFGYLLWVTTVREAIDRLLPVASVGGSVAGVRLLRLRGLAAVPVLSVSLMLVSAVLPVLVTTNVSVSVPPDAMATIPGSFSTLMLGAAVCRATFRTL